MANEITISVKVKNDTTPGLTSVDAALRRVSDSANDSGNAMTRALSSIGSVAGGVLPNIGTMVAAIGASIPIATAAFFSMVPAILAVAGAAGAAATALAGMGAAFGVLKIGFGGIGDALAAHGKAQGGAAKAAGNNAAAQKAAADRIAAASRQLRDAKEAEAQAAKDVNKARADEIDRLRELDLQLRGAKISQAEAAQALVEAKEKQRRADIAGSDWEKAEARNAVARAQLTYDEQTEKLGDLTADKKKAVKDGVEGSDQVQAALEREKKAQERVADAQKALADAHTKTATAAAGAAGGINQFAAAMDKLSPNARKLVYALLDIQKQFDGVRRRVQDRLLAGWDREVRDLADKWIPALDDILVKMAGHLNSLGTAWARALGKDQFIGDIKGATDGFDVFIDKIKGAGVAFIDAFGRISRAASPVLVKIGDLLQRVFEKFDAWITRADNAGSLKSFFEDAADMIDRIFTTTGKVIKIVGQFFEIIYPSSKGAANSAFDSVNEALDNISKWLNDPKNKKSVLGFVEMFKEVGRGIRDLWPLFKFLGYVALLTFTQFSNAVRITRIAFSALGTAAVATGQWIYRSWNSVISWFGRIGDWLSNVLSRAWGGLKSGFRDAINFVIRLWNGLQFKMPALLGGGTVGVPQINYRATGGIASGLTMINERGGELVKLPNGSMVYPSGQSATMMNQQRGGAPVVQLSPARSGDALLDAVWTALAGRIRARGGVVQTALGVPGAK